MFISRTSTSETLINEEFRYLMVVDEEEVCQGNQGDASNSGYPGGSS